MVSETSPRYRPDILERAKAADIDTLACSDWSTLREIVQGLIAEVERLRSQSVEQVFRRSKGLLPQSHPRARGGDEECGCKT